MIKLTLKDGSIRELEAPAAAAEVIKGIGMGLYKASCCVKLDGEVCDLRTVIDHDCTFEVMTFDSEEGKKTFWHTASHVLAQAVKHLYPEAKLAIGPAIDTGFYYDFDVEHPFSQEELTKIEAEMKKIVKANEKLEQFYLSPEEAVAKLKEMDDQGVQAAVLHRCILERFRKEQDAVPCLCGGIPQGIDAGRTSGKAGRSQEA